jgi:hypothetical protein
MLSSVQEAYMRNTSICAHFLEDVPRHTSARVPDNVGRSAPARRTFTMHLSHRHMFIGVPDNYAGSSCQQL